ncbi:UDP-3-O-(3-hydroxymyristoyl)glucosamine N-acyltransferase [Jannaschia sp. LMIT008]|uniref:UDP-3-O-(3-hydroxymyristoyl)glucosamine N-acyltransferase n=1 Tax=Jannaschia maritima TaxID=3032585 RepID=UPI002810A9A6|nr:UDP-3-O-(3-hydroxymyristoyl)glucosamine N-acyltransferase [Jannaschia sp. LMIT008]
MFTLSQIAAALGRPVLGDGAIPVARAAEPSSAGSDDLALAMSPAYGDALRAGAARAAILWDGADWRSFGLAGAITVPRARLAMATITAALDPGPGWARRVGVHHTAILGADVTLGDGVVVGPGAVVGDGVRIGSNGRIGPMVFVGDGAVIGDDALIHARAFVGDRVRIGHRVTCQAGAVIGSDGFSFVTPEESGIERARRTLGDQGDIRPQAWTRIHSLGAVEIGDDVEIGAGATIDRGTVADTVIGTGTKLDNQVHVGHNVRVGRDCLLCGQVGIAGSAVIGDRVVLGGQVGVSDNITVGDDVVAGGGTGILSRVAPGKVLLGYPATDMDKQIELTRAVRRLPRLAKQVAALRDVVMGSGQGTGHDT